jgi:hypothetical protein
MKPVTILITILILMIMAATTHAQPPYFNELVSEVTQRRPGLRLVHQCKTCHSLRGNPQALNPFGKDYFKLVHSAEGSSADEQWDALMNEDSNKNGRSNLEEFEAGDNPGR